MAPTVRIAAMAPAKYRGPASSIPLAYSSANSLGFPRSARAARIPVLAAVEVTSRRRSLRTRLLSYEGRLCRSQSSLFRYHSRRMSPPSERRCRLRAENTHVLFPFADVAYAGGASSVDVAAGVGPDPRTASTAATRPCQPSMASRRAAVPLSVMPEYLRAGPALEAMRREPGSPSFSSRVRTG